MQVCVTNDLTHPPFQIKEQGQYYAERGNWPHYYQVGRALASPSGAHFPTDVSDVFASIQLLLEGHYLLRAQVASMVRRHENTNSSVGCETAPSALSVSGNTCAHPLPHRSRFPSISRYCRSRRAYLPATGRVSLILPPSHHAATANLPSPIP